MEKIVDSCFREQIRELKIRIEKYFGGEEEELPSVLEAILTRKLLKTHEETDDELVEELQYQLLEKVSDEEFESDFEDAHITDDDEKEGVVNLYSARDMVEKRMKQDPYFNMDDKKWDEMIQEAVQHGYLQDTRECEDIFEDMLKWDNLLPDDIKQKVEVKFNELGDMCERQELEPRVVFAPGGDAWHPKNRKVKLSVSVKELGLSKYQFKRLREIVAKRYDPGRNELTITSERFEEREENRKDC